MPFLVTSYHLQRPFSEEVIKESSTQLSKTELLRQGPLYDCACSQGLSMERPGIPFPPALLKAQSSCPTSPFTQAVHATDKPHFVKVPSRSQRKGLREQAHTLIVGLCLGVD